MKETKKPISIFKLAILIIIGLYVYNLFYSFLGNGENNDNKDLFGNSSKTIRILSSYENSNIEYELNNYASRNDIDVDFTYMGDLDIVGELNYNSSEYDAVWISNSMWLYMLDNTYIISDSKSISISPIVVGIKKNKANELNLVDKDITNIDILNLVRDKKIKYVMSSVTRTNTGATAYFGFLDALAGNPEILTEEMLNNERLINNLKSVFSGVERVSGDERYLEEIFLNNNNYEAVISDEASLININKSLVRENKEPLYLLYPTDGVAINDSTFAFIDNGLEKEEIFLKMQNYLLSSDGQKMLQNTGRRTWYGGTNPNANKAVFNPSWGIDTTKYLNVTKYPSKKVMNSAINLYIDKLRKPTHVVFCLDYSGSMAGEGSVELEDAMKYILDYNEASKENLQFSDYDKITVIPFGTTVKGTWTINNGRDTSALLKKIVSLSPNGSTALYDAVEAGLKVLDKESDDYTKTIIAMTDGEVNMGSYENLSYAYRNTNKDIPVYGITFGYAKYEQLEAIANLTNAKVFDGKNDLLWAFKEVRSYN